MKRLKWFNSQTPELQERFKTNCNELNKDYSFEEWINISENHYNYKNYRVNIGSAFVWSMSPEGHQFWSDIDKSIED